MSPAVKTFLSENDFSSKSIVPFITHGGGGQYTIAEDMGKMAKGATVLSMHSEFQILTKTKLFLTNFLKR